MFSLVCVWPNGWVNNGEAGELRRYRAHYDLTVMHCASSAPLMYTDWPTVSWRCRYPGAYILSPATSTYHADYDLPFITCMSCYSHTTFEDGQGLGNRLISLLSTGSPSRSGKAQWNSGGNYCLIIISLNPHLSAVVVILNSLISRTLSMELLSVMQMPQSPTDDKSIFVQVMAWWRQATSHYLSQCWPKPLSLGHNELIPERCTLFPSEPWILVSPGHQQPCVEYWRTTFSSSILGNWL